MEYKKISIESVNKTLGLDVTMDSSDSVVIRAKQGAWLCFFINGYSYSEIGRMFGSSESNVRGGVDRFEDLLKQGDKLTVELWQKLKVYEL